MKDIIGGLKVVVCLAIVLLSFEYSTLWGIVSLVVIGIIFYMSAKKKVYTENPHLRPWVDYGKFEKEQKQINNKPEENHCENCGVETPKKSRFCMNCGSKAIK